MITISDLRNNHDAFHRVCLRLDPESPRGNGYNWRGVAYYLNKHDHIDYKNPEELEKYIGGGGNPATWFIVELLRRKSNLAVSDFCQKAKVLKRGDIVLLLKDKDDLLEELDVTVRSELETMLYPSHGVIVKSWKNFAEEYGFQQDEINNIDELRRAPRQYSPTEGLFKVIQEYNADLNLTFLLKALLHLGRKDVVKIISTAYPNIQENDNNDDDNNDDDDDGAAEGDDAVEVDDAAECSTSGVSPEEYISPEDDVIDLAIIATNATNIDLKLNVSKIDPNGELPLQDSNSFKTTYDKQFIKEEHKHSTSVTNLTNEKEDESGDENTNEDPLTTFSVVTTNTPPHSSRDSVQSSTTIIEEDGVDDNDDDDKQKIVDLSTPASSTSHVGLCLIVNNFKYKQEKLQKYKCSGATTNKGPKKISKIHANKDEKSIEELFELLNCDVKKFRNKTVSEMKDIPDGISTNKKLSYIVCFIMVSGTSDNKIYGIKNDLLAITEFVNIFDERFPDQPKVFFIQSTQSKSSCIVNEDEMESLSVSNNTLIQLCSLKEKISYRQKEKGSWFIQGLLSSMKKYHNLRKTMENVLGEVLQDDSESSNEETRKALKMLGKWKKFHHDVTFK